MKTYRQLLVELNRMTEDDLDQTITVYDGDEEEFFGVTMFIESSDACDVVDPGHLLLAIKEVKTVPSVKGVGDEK